MKRTQTNNLWYDVPISLYEAQSKNVTENWPHLTANVDTMNCLTLLEQLERLKELKPKCSYSLKNSNIPNIVLNIQNEVSVPQETYFSVPVLLILCISERNSWKYTFWGEKE